MYLRATSYPLSLLRFLAVCAVLLLGAVKEGYGQRVYANEEQLATTLTSTVTNRKLPINEDSFDDFSSLNALISLLGLGSASQNLQFIGARAPNPLYPPPIMIKFGSTSSILGLVNNISLRLTNNGIAYEVGEDYTSNSLLTLLNDSEASELIVRVPPNSINYDGIRLKINATVGLVLSARLYYAFYITPPEIPSTVTVCSGESAAVNVTNYKPELGELGYTYRLYDVLTGGKALPGVTFNNGNLTLPADLPQGVYYLEARENDIYPSARTEISVAVIPQPGKPNLTITGVQN